MHGQVKCRAVSMDSQDQWVMTKLFVGIVIDLIVDRDGEARHICTQHRYTNN